jgi:hypothetical protein
MRLLAVGSFKRFEISRLLLASMLVFEGHETQAEANMDNSQTDITSIVRAIEAAFGGRWAVWLSDTGWWWASRSVPLTAAGLGAGCVPFLRAQTPAGLIEGIQDQEDLQMRAAGTTQQTVHAKATPPGARTPGMGPDPRP